MNIIYTIHKLASVFTNEMPRQNNGDIAGVNIIIKLDPEKFTEARRTFERHLDQNPHEIKNSKFHDESPDFSYRYVGIWFKVSMMQEAFKMRSNKRRF